MPKILSPIDLLSFLEVDSRRLNVVKSGSTIKVETKEEYLARVPKPLRRPGMEVCFLSPAKTFADSDKYTEFQSLTEDVYKFGIDPTDDSFVAIPSSYSRMEIDAKFSKTQQDDADYFDKVGLKKTALNTVHWVYPYVVSTDPDGDYLLFYAASADDYKITKIGDNLCVFKNDVNIGVCYTFSNNTFYSIDDANFKIFQCTIYTWGGQVGFFIMQMFTESMRNPIAWTPLMMSQHNIYTSNPLSTSDGGTFQQGGVNLCSPSNIDITLRNNNIIDFGLKPTIVPLDTRVSAAKMYSSTDRGGEFGFKMPTSDITAFDKPTNNESGWYIPLVQVTFNKPYPDKVKVHIAPTTQCQGSPMFKISTVNGYGFVVCLMSGTLYSDAMVYDGWYRLQYLVQYTTNSDIII